MGKIKSWWHRHTVTQDDRKQMVVLLMATVMFGPLIIASFVFMVMQIFAHPFMAVSIGLAAAIYIWVNLTITTWVRKGKK